MNIIIFGANSNLGIELINKLIKNKNKILSISRTNLELKNENIKFLNLKDLDKIFFDKYYSIVNTFLNTKVDVIIYLPTIRDNEFKINSDNINIINEIYNINSLNLIKFIEYNISKSIIGKTHIVYTSSVSTFLNLKKNMYYGSGKILSEFYLKSLSLKYPKLNLVIYKLGYLNTKKNTNKKFFLPKCDLNNVSNFIIKGFFNHRNIKIYPFYWIIIKYIILILPKKLIYFFYRR